MKHPNVNSSGEKKHTKEMSFKLKSSAVEMACLAEDFRRHFTAFDREANQMRSMLANWYFFFLQFVFFPLFFQLNFSAIASFIMDDLSA